MEKENKISATSYRVEPELRKAMAQACVDNDGLTQTDIVNEGVRMWLEKHGRTGAPPLKVSAADLGKWHTLLKEVLDSGRKDAIVAVQENLRVFSAYVKLPRRA